MLKENIFKFLLNEHLKMSLTSLSYAWGSKDSDAKSKVRPFGSSFRSSYVESSTYCGSSSSTHLRSLNFLKRKRNLILRKMVINCPFLLAIIYHFWKYSFQKDFDQPMYCTSKHIQSKTRIGIKSKNITCRLFGI